MKYYFDGIIVVEGSGDVSYLSSFIESNYVITNGYDIPASTIEYLKTVNSKKPILILTDSDKAGFEIRKKLHEYIKGEDVVVNLEFCNKHGKHGIAECDKQELINKLSNYLLDKAPKNQCNEINESILFLLGINNREISLFIGKKFAIGKCNKKQMCKRLNSLGITKEALEETVKEFNHGNQ